MADWCHVNAHHRRVPPPSLDKRIKVRFEHTGVMALVKTAERCIWAVI